MKHCIVFVLIFFFVPLFASELTDDAEDDLLDGFEDGFEDDVEDDVEDDLEDVAEEDFEDDFEDDLEDDVKESPKKSGKDEVKSEATESAVSVVSGNTKISTEGYISFLKKKGTKVYSPSYITLNAASDYHFDGGFQVTGWFDSMIGFPDKAVAGGFGNFLYQSYGNGGVRVIASYSHKEVVEVGFATTLRFYNSSDSNAAPIDQGAAGSNYNGPRKHYLLQETFILSEPIKGLKLYANFGLNNQSFQIQDITGADVNLVDTNLMLQTLVSYEILQYVIPYVGVDHNNDLNSSSAFNLTRIHAGIRGDILRKRSINLHYRVGYRREEGDMILEPDRILVSAGMRWNIFPRFDFFADMYQEFSIAEADKSFHYVNRNMKLMARGWPIAGILAVGGGAYLRFEERDKTAWFPLSPFIEATLLIDNFRAYTRVIVDFDRNISTVAGYGHVGQRVDVAVSYRTPWITPLVGFYLNSGSFPKKAYNNVGIRLAVTSTF